MHKVYHGSTHIIKQPLCHIGRDNLDFGKGFYVTNIKKQAISWATRVNQTIRFALYHKSYSMQVYTL